MNNRNSEEGTPLDNFCESHHNEGNKDTDRHYRMLSFVLPLLNIFKRKSNHWLTAGDGLGREAIFLKKHGVSRVTCSNIWFTDFNKEKLSEHVDRCMELDMCDPPLLTEAPDFILIKEALHHLNRPLYGLYQLLDLSGSGLVFIEPHEVRHHNGEWSFQNNSFLLSTEDEDLWETAGNYKYRFSVRETCKMAWALSLPHVAVRGLNDASRNLYDKPTEEDPDDAKYSRYLDRCDHLDKLGASNKRPYNLIVCAILKKTLNSDERAALKDFLIIDNPSK